MGKKRNKFLTQGIRFAEQFENVKPDQREEYASAYADYMLMARKADVKLRALEALSHEQYYKGVLSYSYARAQKDIAKWAGEEYTKESKYGRFERKPPETLAQLYAKMNDIERFLDSTTSTKSGIKGMYKKRADTMNKKFSTDLGGKKLTWQEVADYFEKEYNSKLDSKVGSGSQFVALGLMKRYGIDEEQTFNDVLALRKDSDLKDDVLAVVDDSSYLKKLAKTKDDKYIAKVKSIAENTKSIEAFRKVDKDASNKGKFIKSPKVERDIAVMLAQEDIDLATLFEGTKRKGKK